MSEHTLRVLVVDDEESVRGPLADRLREIYHYYVDVACDGLEALHLLDEAHGRYDVAVIDQILEGDISGPDLLRDIKDRYPEIQVIVFTGWGLKEDEGINILRKGAYRYIAKGNYDELALTIRFAAEEGWTRLERQYMAALVKVGQGLTQTTQQDEQLRLAWDFVREQLDVSTFFIGLAPPDRKRIYFPLAYDEGQQIDLEDTILGKSRREWGLAGYVVKTGEEILWSTLDELEQTRKARKTIPILVGKSSVSGFCIPLRIGEQIRGVLSAQSYGAQVFTPVLQNALRALSSQLSVALENSRLFSEAEQRTKDIENQASSLAALQGLALTINSSLNPDEILTRTCQAAVEFFHADSSGLVLFNSEFIRGKVEAEYPALGALGKIIPVRGIPAEEQLIETREPLNVYDVAAYEPFGVVRDTLGELGIQSVLIVPIISKGQVLGTFSLDAVHQPRRFSDEEIESCKTFAAQVAVAIENARLFEEAKRWAEQLEALRHTTLAITSPLDRTTLLDTLIKQAVELLDAESGGVYEYSPERGELTVIADHKRPKHLGKTLRVGEGMAGQLVQSGAPFLIVEDYNEWSGRASIYADGRPFGAVLEVPLKWHENVIGVLYIDDEVGRKFTSADAHLLCLFADQAAIALVNAELIARNEGKLRRLEKLAKVTKEITGNLGSMTLDELLTLIAKHATDTLDAEVCGIHLVKREGFLSLEASYGHREGGFQKGREFAICSGPKTGLTGHIAYEGKLFNAHGDVLKNHFAVRGVEPDHLPSGECYSLLAIPLKKKEGKTEKLVGLLRAENKKQDGRALPALSFTKEDEWILNIFAEVVVVAIENARRVTELKDARDYHRRLVDTAPDGVIQVNEKGWITLFNQGAERILGYKRDDVQNRKKRVDDLYWNPEDPKRIKQHLREHEQLEGFRTAIKSKKGERIPILLSATRTEEPRDGRFGSIGYFKVFSDYEQAEADLRFLLDVTTDVAKAQSLQEGLNTLAKKMVDDLRPSKVTFCYIMLLDDKEHNLVARAAHPAPRGQGLNWKPGVDEKKLSLADAPTYLRELLEGPGTRILHKSNPEEQIFLRRIAMHLELEDSKTEFRDQPGKEIVILMAIPLKIPDHNLGICFLGEVRNREDNVFSQRQANLADAVGVQASILIDRMQAHETTRHQLIDMKNLRSSAEAMIRKVSDKPKETLEIVAKAACEVIGAGCAIIYPFHRGMKFYDRENITFFWLLKKDREFSDKERDDIGSMTGQVSRKRLIIVDDVRTRQDRSGEVEIWRDPGSLMADEGIEAFVGVALQSGEKSLGALFLNFRSPHYFRDYELDVIHIFADQASAVIQQSRLFQQVSDEAIKLRHSLLDVGTGIVELQSLQDTLKAIAHGLKTVLDCDVVTAYSYDHETGIFPHPAIVAGDLDVPQKMCGYGLLLKSTVFSELVRNKKPYYAEHALTDPVMGAGNFAAREKVKSSVGVTIWVEDHPAGILFANFRNQHQFSPAERDAIRIFANQAAVAIRNAQLHDETHKRAEVLEGLYETGNAITSTLALNEVLARIAEQALHIVGADPQKGCFSHVALLNGDKLRFIAGFPLEILTDLRQNVGEIDLQRDAKRGIAGLAVITGQSKNEPEVSNEPNWIPLRENINIHAQLSVPLKIGEQIIGVLSIEHPQPAAFDEEDVRNVELLAAQAAVAIENARLFNTAEQRAHNLDAVIRVSQTVISSLDLDHTLTAACQAAVELLGVDHSGLVLFEEDLAEGVVRAEYPDMGVRGAVIRLRGVPAEEQLIKSMQPLMVIDVASERAFEPVRDILKKLGTRSMLIVPILRKGKILGSFGLDVMKHQRVFTQEELEICKVFAAQVAVAIENARQYEALEKTKEALAARTALAWTGMISSTWRHAIEKHAITIRDQIELCRRDLAESPRADSLSERLNMIERLANRISEKQITPPLSSEEGVTSVQINELIEERVRRLWEDESYKPVARDLKLHLEDNMTVRASPEWLRRALDILMDNAIDAIARIPEPKIIIATQRVGDRVEIRITDNGKGIPADVLPYLLRRQITKVQGEKGLGIGLLFAQMIAQTYSGDIRVGSPGPGDTTMIIVLPLES